MVKELTENIKQNLINIPGWRTKRRIIVFESDDWGSIRMASKESFNQLLRKRYPVDQCAYNINDALEDNDDLERLFQIIRSVVDNKGNPAVFTLNFTLANPDFTKIKQGLYQEYFYEPFTSTLEKYPNHSGVYTLYKDAIEQNIMNPQFHGREHLHVPNWLGALQKGDRGAIDTFELNMFTTYRGSGSSCNKEYLDAFGIYDKQQKQLILSSVIDGLSLFEKTWGRQAKSAIAPCYIWGDEVETVLAENGIMYIQSGRVQKKPTGKGISYKYKRRYTGQRNKLGQTYSIRNVIFEPSSDLNKDWVNDALGEIRIAFNWRKPAIISTHRLNYIGSINPKNTNRNLPLLEKLLQRIVFNWPDVEFMSSAQLGELMNSTK